MSKSGDATSVEGLDLSSKSEVRDFLYNDARRIGSYLSQFDPFGHLQSIKTSDAAGENQSTKSTFAGKAGVPLVAEASGAGEILTGTTGAETSERNYDPLWANALAFIDYLQHEKQLKTSVAGAQIGDFVAVQGHLSIVDLGLMKGILANAKMKKALVAQVKTASSSSHKKSVEITEEETALELFSVLPMNVQAYFLSAMGWIWATLVPEYLTTSVSDLHLKHGTLISGQWTILGVLDAVPGGYDDAPSLIPDGPVRALATMMKLVRPALGRPNDYFGMTPLLIYRTVLSETDEAAEDHFDGGEAAA